MTEEAKAKVVDCEQLEMLAGSSEGQVAIFDPELLFNGNVSNFNHGESKSTKKKKLKW
jgi:hypothetical protein